MVASIEVDVASCRQAGGIIAGAAVLDHPPLAARDIEGSTPVVDTSLVLYGKSVRRCPRVEKDVVDRRDPSTRFPAGCDTWRCPVCGPRIARRKAEIITWAQPTRFLTLTMAPADWTQLRMKVRRLRMRLHRDGFPTNWAWTVEQGKKTGMVHVHALQHGSFIPQRLLQERWGARVDIRRVKDDGATSYILKEAARVASYAMKGTALDLQQHLDLNGGRGCHLSRGFLHGRTSDEVWSLLHPPDELRSWIVVPAGEPLPAHLVLAGNGPKGP